MPTYPISFSIHPSKIVADVPPKTRLLAFIDPNDTSTYIYDNETDYYQDYRSSYFAVTKKKAGWDCMRHYEILANGCIPMFEGLTDCPERTMVHFPKEIILESNQLFLEIIESCSSVEEMTPAHRARCDHYIRILLDYTREHLSNPGMARYMLRTVGFQDFTIPRKTLYLFERPYPDYLKDTNLAGFKELLGTECHDHPRTEYVYQSEAPLATWLYGRGMTYTRLLDPALHNGDYDGTLEADIRAHVYDLVIYGSYHRGMPYWDLVNQHYTKNEIVLVCGEDFHACDHANFEGYHVFVRELS